MTNTCTSSLISSPPPPRSSPFRRNGSPTCNQNRDRKLPMNFFSSPLFHTFFLPFSFAFSKTIGYLTGYLLPISFAHGVSNVIVAKNVLQLELKYPARDGFRFVFDRLFRLLDNFISVPSFCSPSLSLSLSPFPPPFLPTLASRHRGCFFPLINLNKKGKRGGKDATILCAVPSNEPT